MRHRPSCRLVEAREEIHGSCSIVGPGGSPAPATHPNVAVPASRRNTFSIQLFLPSPSCRNARPAAGSRPPSPWCPAAGSQAAAPPSGMQSKARTSRSRYRRWPPGVRLDVSFPDLAQRVTVLGFTRNRLATSPGVSSFSLSSSRRVEADEDSLGIRLRLSVGLVAEHY